MADATEVKPPAAPTSPAPAPGGRPAGALPVFAPPSLAPASQLRPGPPPKVSGAVEALKWGLASAWTCRRALLFVLALQFLLAILSMLPLLGTMDSTLSRHPDAAAIGRDLDFRWWTDWTIAQAGLVAQSMNLLGAAALLAVLAGTFFAGGLLEALKQGPAPRLTFEPLAGPVYRGATPDWRAAAPTPASPQILLRESARRFPRFLLLLAISLPFYGIVHLALNRWALIGLAALLENVEDERLGVALNLARAGIFVAAFHAVTVVFEYARAQEILRPGSGLGEMIGLSFSILRSRPAALLGIEAAAFTMQAAAMLLFIPVDRALGAAPLAALTVGLAASQAFLFLRLLLRSGANAAQLRLAQDHISRAG